MKTITPTPEQIKKTRIGANLTQKQAAELINVNLRSWQKYEGGEREMHPAFWELFLIKINGQYIVNGRCS